MVCVRIGVVLHINNRVKSTKYVPYPLHLQTACRYINYTGMHRTEFILDNPKLAYLTVVLLTHWTIYKSSEQFALFSQKIQVVFVQSFGWNWATFWEYKIYVYRFLRRPLSYGIDTVYGWICSENKIKKIRYISDTQVIVDKIHKYRMYIVCQNAYHWSAKYTLLVRMVRWENLKDFM